jgi:hypothetical protein
MGLGKMRQAGQMELSYPADFPVPQSSLSSLSPALPAPFQAQAEAAALVSVRGQVVELQGALSGLGQQMAAEQAVRRSDVQALDRGMKAAEAQLGAAQDALARHTAAMVDGRAAHLMKALQVGCWCMGGWCAPVLGSCGSCRREGGVPLLRQAGGKATDRIQLVADEKAFEQPHSMRFWVRARFKGVG